MAFSRIIVIAPTKATCENLHYLIGLDSLPETLLARLCGGELRQATAKLPQGGFGLLAGTGAGKSAEIRQLCYRIFGRKPSIGLVTQEHQSTGQTRNCNVLVITPGIAVQWAKNGQITKADLIVLDEVHQTSEHLELAMALIKRLGCTFIWMSATIDPLVYQEYLGSRTVIECSAYDIKHRATVSYHRNGTAQQFMEGNLQKIAANQRGVALFVPGRKDAEALAKKYNGQHGVHVSFYHGGVPAEELKRFIEGSIPRPYVIVMTPAGASSLNIVGLDTVVIVDSMYREVINGGKRKLVSTKLDTNTLLQMAGRVDGRAINGEVHIITDNANLDLRALRPVSPSFVLGGDLEVLALTTAQMGIDARDLSLIGGLELDAYNAELNRLMARGIITRDQTPKLTSLGKQIDKMSIGSTWGLVMCSARLFETAHPGLIRLVALTASAEGLYQLTQGDWAAKGERADRLAVAGSDHLTGYNIVAVAIRNYGRKIKDGYQIGGEQFMKWCNDRLYSPKGIRSAAMQYTTIMRRLDIGLPEPKDFEAIEAGSSLHRAFIELLAATQSMDYVRDGMYGDRYVNDNGRRGASYGKSVLGSLRHWNNRRGQPCIAIEGTEIPQEVVEAYATRRYFKLLEFVSHSQVRALYRRYFAGEYVGDVELLIAPSELPPVDVAS